MERRHARSRSLLSGDEFRLKWQSHQYFVAMIDASVASWRYSGAAERSYLPQYCWRHVISAAQLTYLLVRSRYCHRFNTTGSCIERASSAGSETVRFVSNCVLIHQEIWEVLKWALFWKLAFDQPGWSRYVAVLRSCYGGIGQHRRRRRQHPYRPDMTLYQ